MLGGLLRFFRRKPVVLVDVPRQRREKNYQAESGRTFRYFYLGRSVETYGARYWFEISSGGQSFCPVAVKLSRAELEPWEQRHGRKLSAVERYAIAKLSLHAALDREHGAALPSQVSVSAGDVESILQKLGLD